MPATVKVIGISSGVTYDDGASASPLKFCQLWFIGESVPKTTVAEYVIVPETHDRKSVFSAVLNLVLFNFIVDHERQFL